jgi:TIR domain
VRFTPRTLRRATGRVHATPGRLRRFTGEVRAEDGEGSERDGGSRTWSGNDRRWDGDGRTWDGKDRRWDGDASTWGESDRRWDGDASTWNGGRLAALGSRGVSFVNTSARRGLGMPSYDVFLSHNSKDKPAVRQLFAALQARKLNPWLDEEHIDPGKPWLPQVEAAIQTIPAAAVLVGADGLGPWEEVERRAVISAFVRRQAAAVIPVLLPGAAKEPELPLFLQDYAWVDLRDGLTPEGMARLVWGITGKKPQDGPSPAKAVQEELPPIFLAETSSDLLESRSFVAKEIAGLCAPRPTSALSRTLAELTASLSSELSACRLSVHLLGPIFGLIPEGEESRSLAQIQLEQAETTGIRCLVWSPQDLSQVDARQRRFLEEINLRQGAGLEVIPGALQDFARYLKDVLEKLRRPVRQAKSGKRIYIVVDTKDVASPELLAIRNHIWQKSFDVKFPDFEGTLADMTRAEEQAILDSDATLLFWGECQDSWALSRSEAIAKKAIEAQLPEHELALYLGSPNRPKKQLYLNPPGGRIPFRSGLSFLLLGDCTGFSTAELDRLL